jgi:sulfite reductase (NADPH) hemoprotein beta-component
VYQYDEIDLTLVRERAAQFREQLARYRAGKLTDDEFRPMRLRNGLYMQRFAPMLRINIPYGHMSAPQLRKMGHIARTYSKGYAHFTTRQNIQLHWPPLDDVPDILVELAEVEMQCIQACGNDTRNITCDYLAGVSADEIIDPRPYCELLRQWEALNPEFLWLPRKFKFAFTGAKVDRAATRTNDVAIHLVHNEAGEIGYRFYVGGGLGRMPILGKLTNDFVPESDLLIYSTAIMRVFNRFGRRDNIHHARIKVVVKTWGLERFIAAVHTEYQRILASAEAETLRLLPEDVDHMRSFFPTPAYRPLAEVRADLSALASEHREFGAWLKRNVGEHRQPGYRIAYVSLKAHNVTGGDVSAEQYEALAELTEIYGFGELRSTFDQNLVLPDVAERDLYPLWQRLKALNLATPNIGLLTDMICCPGLDFCGLANASSISVYHDIYDLFDKLDDQYAVGPIRITMSGCMNGCGHHSVGHIGILGVDKHGEEWYQVTLGGNPSNDPTLGERAGRALSRSEIAGGVERIVHTYLDLREGEEETFLDCYRRLGLAPFKERLYATEAEAA